MLSHDEFIKQLELQKKIQTKQSIGYKTPPTWTRFKKGQSGNPRGRPKKQATLESELATILDQKINMTENGVQTKISLRRAIILAQVKKALSGDTKAFTALSKYCEVIDRNLKTASEHEDWLLEAQKTMNSISSN